jgi:hypothetical protein
MTQRSFRRLLTACAVLVACGGKQPEDRPVKDDAAPAGPTAAPIAVPTSGVDRIDRMNYVWGSPGSKEYGKAIAACCKGKTRDWDAARSHAEAAIAKDAHHLGAHWVLGTALVQQGDHAAAVDHLVHALASDHGHYGPRLAADKELEPLRATSHGTALTELSTRIAADYKKRAAGGLLVVARRSAFRWPNPGVQYASTRGELYAFDRETRHYLRLTHTNDTVAGYVRSPSGTELAVLGFTKIDRPKGDDVTPLIVNAYVVVFDTSDWKAGKRVTIPGPAREISLGYGPGDQLLLATAPAAGRWGIGAPQVFAVDRSTGKLAKLAAPLPVPRIVFSLEEGRVLRAPGEQVKAAWAGDPPAAPSLEIAGKTIAIPESGSTTRATVALGGKHVAFATAVDPCAEHTAPSLYVAETASATLKHLLTAKSRFTTRWVTPALLAYEDGDGAIRLWDAGTGREASRLENKAGLALEVLSLAPAPLCKQAPPKATTASGGDPDDHDDGAGGDELPPEEPATPR